MKLKDFGEFTFKHGGKELIYNNVEYNKKITKEYFETSRNEVEFKFGFLLSISKLSKNHGKKPFYIYFIDDLLEKKLVNNDLLNVSFEEYDKLELSYDYNHEREWRVENSKENQNVYKNIVVAGSAKILLARLAKENGSQKTIPLYLENGNPLIFDIEFSYSPSSFNYKLFQHLKKELKPYNYNDITSYFKIFEHLLNKVPKNEYDQNRILYYRIKDLFVPFIELTESIFFDPIFEIVPRIECFTPELINNIDSTESHISNGTIIDTSTSFKNNISFWGIKTYKEEYSNANLFVKESILNFINKIDDIVNSLKNYISENKSMLKSRTYNKYKKEEIENSIKKHQEIINELEKFNNTLKSLYEKFLPSSSINISPNFIALNSELLNFDFRYSLFNQYMLLFFTLIDFIDDSEEYMSFNIIPFNKMYQLWVFNIVLQILKDYGFIIINEDTKISFYNNYKENFAYELYHEKHSDYSFRLYYEKIFDLQQYNSDAKVGVPSRQNLPLHERPKFSPDITVEIEKPGSCHPYYLILDPTLGRKAAEEKLKYRDHLRCLVCSTMEANQQVPSRVVISVWGIYPDIGSLFTNPDIEPIMDENYGLLKLNHLEQTLDNFKQNLTTIIDNFIGNSIQNFNRG